MKRHKGIHLNLTEKLRRLNIEQPCSLGSRARAPRPGPRPGYLMGTSPQNDSNEARWCASLVCVGRAPRSLEETECVSTPASPLRSLTSPVTTG